MDPLLADIDPSVAEGDEEHSGGYYRYVNWYMECDIWNVDIRNEANAYIRYFIPLCIYTSPPC